MGNDVIKGKSCGTLDKPLSSITLRKSQDIKSPKLDISTTKCIDIPQCHMNRDYSNGSLGYKPSFKNMYVSVSDKDTNIYLSGSEIDNSQDMFQSSHVYDDVIQRYHSKSNIECGSLCDISMCNENEILKRFKRFSKSGNVDYSIE